MAREGQPFMTIIEVTNCFLVEIEVHSTGGNSCLLLETWSKVHDWEDIGSEGNWKLIPVVLLNAHAV